MSSRLSRRIRSLARIASTQREKTSRQVDGSACCSFPKLPAVCPYSTTSQFHAAKTLATRVPLQCRGVTWRRAITRRQQSGPFKVSGCGGAPLWSAGFQPASALAGWKPALHNAAQNCCAANTASQREREKHGMPPRTTFEWPTRGRGRLPRDYDGNPVMAGHPRNTRRGVVARLHRRAFSIALSVG